MSLETRDISLKGSSAGYKETMAAAEITSGSCTDFNKNRMQRFANILSPIFSLKCHKGDMTKNLNRKICAYFELDVNEVFQTSLNTNTTLEIT